MEITKKLELLHYGVKGMHWGVRRYQNTDGTLTEAGRERQIYIRRARNAARTKSDVDKIWNSLSYEDKKMLGGEDSKEWLSIEEGEYVVKRIIEKYGDMPVAFMDIMTTTKPGHATIGIATDPNHRNQGLAYKMATKGKEWFDKNADKYGFNYLGWGAYANNIKSRKLAEKVGFNYEPDNSDDEWSVYGYRKK